MRILIFSLLCNVLEINPKCLCFNNNYVRIDLIKYLYIKMFNSKILEAFFMITSPLLSIFKIFVHTCNGLINVLSVLFDFLGGFIEIVISICKLICMISYYIFQLCSAISYVFKFLFRIRY